MRVGATSIDVTDIVHPYNRFVCERISRILNLDCTGIDIISEDISKSLHDNGGRVIEINAAPDFRMHINPTIGHAKPVQKQFVDMLFPEGSNYKIPHISVTGTKGKTFLTQLLSSVLTLKGETVGCLNSKGIFVNNQLLRPIDTLDSNYVSIIFKDPTVTFAVTETNVESILEYGLGYKWATIGIFLNLESKDEYYNYDHIRDIDDIAYTKSVVLEEIELDGLAILNADNKLIMEAEERIDVEKAYFSLYPDNPITRSLIDKHATIAIFDIDRIVVYKDKDRFTPLYLDEIPHIPIVEDYHKQALLALCLCLVYLGYNDREIRNAVKSVSL